METHADTLSGAPVGDIQDMELREEWQDDGFPRPLPEDCESPDEESPESGESQTARPTSLALSGVLGGGAKKRLAAPTLSLTLSRADSLPDGAGTPSLDINLEALDTPSDSESGTLPGSPHDLEWEDDLPRPGHGMAVSPVGGASSPGAELTEDQVDSRGRQWRRFCVSGQELRVNMSSIQPYLQVLSHGGYYGDGMNAIILFSSCFLPEDTVEEYQDVMENLFRYIVGTLDLMVSEHYQLVLLCGAAPRNKLPAVRWLHQCYTSIDRRLKKELKALLVVHPAWYIKVLITLVKPFISEKFSRKIRFVHSLQELEELIPTDRLQIPPCVRQLDEKMSR